MSKFEECFTTLKTDNPELTDDQILDTYQDELHQAADKDAD